MRLIRGISNWQDTRPSVITIGNFDGAHLGHQAMFASTRRIANERNALATAISFEPLPHEYFTADTAAPRLQGLRDRVSSLSDAGMIPACMGKSAYRAHGFVSTFKQATLAMFKRYWDDRIASVAGLSTVRKSVASWASRRPMWHWEIIALPIVAYSRSGPRMYNQVIAMQPLQTWANDPQLEEENCCLKCTHWIRM